MSSIIVLDSSDEDESPPKKSSFKSTLDSNAASVTNTSSSKNYNPKQRQIPSGITITPRLSPTSMTAKSSNIQSLNSSSLAASYQTLNSIINNERQTPTPPKGQMVGSINQRKRKTPTPPKAMPRLTAKSYATMSNSSPAKAATTMAPLPPIMPMITGVHSMAAGTTPPLQLMATPPHGLGTLMGLNEQLMINPHLIPTSLPSSTTITAHPNPNQNNINNNFKIHLPFNKPTTTTPSPAASPASSGPKTPSPQLAPSPQPSRADKNTKRIMPTTLLKSSDESWQRHKQITQNGKQLQRTPVSLNNDVVIEMLPPSTDSPKSISASSSRHHTPMASPTTPKSQKSPDVIMLTPLSNHTVRKECETILDLTRSPDKVIAPSVTEIVDLVDTPDKPSKNTNVDAKHVNPEKKPEKPPPKPPLEPEYEELIKACRKADPSKDMEKLIKSKLIKYYYEVHNDYVKSKSFRKNIRKVLESIKAKPDLVYYNLKTIVEELKVRRKARLVEEAAATNTNVAATTTTVEDTASNSVKCITSETNSNENDVKNTTTTESNDPGTSTTSAEISATLPASTGNKKLDEQIKKLNKALYVLTKRIEVLEQSEVDWDDDDSSFLQVERYKKRACQIYEKICDLTGESKNAHRLVKKPIKFNETRIPQFNKTLQAFINRTKEFPDYYDVLRMLEHCNRTYSLGLVNFEIKNIAEDAFIKVGKLLQSRRKADLYETVTHFAGDGKDPAKTDPKLAAKLNENLKNHKKISDILEKFARKQDMPEEQEEKAEKAEENEADDMAKKETEPGLTTEILYKDNQNGDIKNEVLIKTEGIKNETLPASQVKMDVDEVEEYEDDDDEDEDEEDEENLDDQVETLANGDISDNESDNEIMPSKDNKNSSKNLSLPDTSVKCLNNDSVEIEESRVSPTNTKNVNELSAKCIEIPDNSQEFLMTDNRARNVIDKESPAIKTNSETDSLLINNNNLDISANTTKTVKNANTTEFSAPSSPPIPLASIIYTSNGKIKDQLLNHDNATTLYTATNPSIINTATLATTTTADLKIVHVSSLEPDSNNAAANNNDGITLNEVGRKITSANKSLDEIVISDEES